MKHIANRLLAEGYNCQPCQTELGVENRAIVILEDFIERGDGTVIFDDFHPLCATHSNVRIPVDTPIVDNWSDMF